MHLASGAQLPFGMRVAFALKKFVSFWLMPLPLCLVLICAGVVLLGWSQRKRLGRALALSGAILLLFFSNKTVSMWLIQPLEALYPAVPDLTETASLPGEMASCRYVIVLGGGHTATPGLSSLSSLSNSARGRLTEGIRLLRHLPDAKLIVSGAAELGERSHAAVLEEAALSLGVPPERIVRMDDPRDTADEARIAAALVRDERCALVTSAWHMRRALALFSHAGVHAVPCPADYQAKRETRFRWSNYTWDSEALGRSTWAIYERIGFLWAKLRGQV